MENINIVLNLLNNIILEAEIVGMHKQEDKFGYADTDDLDKAIAQLLEALNMKDVKVQNGFISLSSV